MEFGLYSTSAELLNIMGCWLQRNFIIQFIHLTSVLEDEVLVIVGDIFSVDAQRTLRLPVWLIRILMVTSASGTSEQLMLFILCISKSTGNMDITNNLFLVEMKLSLKNF